MRFKRCFDSNWFCPARVFSFLKAELLSPVRSFFDWEESGASQGVLEGRHRQFDLPSPNWKAILRIVKWTIPAILLVVLVVLEMRTSALQSRVLTALSKKMSYKIESGQSNNIVFPHTGPLDERLGYDRIPEFEAYLKSQGFSVTKQAKFSDELALGARLGLTPPYREPTDAGLLIRDNKGDALYKTVSPDSLFPSYDAIPPLVVETLLFIENRELRGEPADYRANPTVDWSRLTKATLTYIGEKLGLPIQLQGGSTLATQMEKYRHSSEGRTESPADKLRQMISASLNVYKEGVDTRVARRQIIIDYLNSVPLGAAPGFGEVNGLGDGLRAWFGTDLRDACRQLSTSDPSPQVFKQVLSLLYAARAPSYFLVQGRSDLDKKVNSYVRLLTKAHAVDSGFAGRVEEAAPNFLSRSSVKQTDFPFSNKARNAIRSYLLRVLHVPGLYELDRLHLEVNSTIDSNLQSKASQLFDELHDVNFLAAHGLLGEHLLSAGNPDKVNYSIMLFESRPEGNLLRVQTDTFKGPFDVNEGVKLQLGSTAKLRTLAHYLELVTSLYKDMSHLDGPSLTERALNAKDPITRWAAQTLAGNTGIDPFSFLQAALDRTYSANPNETFFTGGGIHNFVNFDKDDNHSVLTIREGLIGSVNLVFVRLMRDLTLFHEARLPYDPASVLTNSEDPDRTRLLKQIAEDEARQFLLKAYVDYRGLPPDAGITRLLGRQAHNPRDLAILCFAWNPETRLHPEKGLAGWFASLGEKVSPVDVEKLAMAYGSPKLDLADYGYLLSVHPLEIWCLGELRHEPGLSWTGLWNRSGAAREIASSWLFNTRNRHAQDLRLRIRIEADAFARMTPYWQKLGFPFDRLVPSLATALGSSSDRPAALAELMGIILNDGVRRPTYEIKDMTFASGTPYQTLFGVKPVEGKRVMDPAVARSLREVLAQVVERGTARRAAGAFVGPDGGPLIAGGKTGSGDNRFETFARGGAKTSSTPTNRTATFVFYIGHRYFGVITAYVEGLQSGEYGFTSALPVALLKLLSSPINSSLTPSAPIIRGRTIASDCIY
jgi:membrane peptidoglycan carboxypeptidase